MANDFEDFTDDVFAAPNSAPPSNAFESFDDDIFRGKPAAEFDQFDSDSSPPPKQQLDVRKRPISNPPPPPSSNDFDDFDEPVLKKQPSKSSVKPAPPPGPPPKAAALPPPRPAAKPRAAPNPPSEDEDDDFGRPPPPPPSASKPRPPPSPPPEDDDDEFPAPSKTSRPPPGPPPSPPAPPSKKPSFDVSKPKAAAGPPPPPPPPPPGADFDDEQSDDEFAPPPPGPPPRPSHDEYDEEMEPPPPESPPQSDDDEAAPPPPPPPAEEYEEYDEQYDEQPPPPPPPRKSWDASSTDEDENNDHEAVPPPSGSPPPDDEEVFYEEPEPPAVVVEAAPGLPPPRSRAVPRQAPPPPVSEREPAAAFISERRSSVGSVGSLNEGQQQSRRMSFSDAVLQTGPAPPPPHSASNGISLPPPPAATPTPVTQPAGMMLPPAPQVEEVRQPVIVLAPPSTSQQPVMILPPPKDGEAAKNSTLSETARALASARSTMIESVEDIIGDEEEKADEKLSRKDSQESLSKTMRPPEHPPPPEGIFKRRTSSQSSLDAMGPPNHPPPSSSPTAEKIAPAKSKREGLSPTEEKQIALRLLRAVDTQTRTLNQRLIRFARDLYEASDLDADGKVSFLELAAAVKMIDPELSVDQAVKFVQGLATRAGLKLSRDYFENASEFELSLSRATGLDVAMPSDYEGGNVEEPDKDGAIVLSGNAGTLAPMSASSGTSTAGRTLEQYALWIDSLEIWPPIVDVVEAMKSGVLLCKLVEHLVRQREDARFRLRGVNSKPRTKAPCLQNLELALGIVWKQRVVARNMPTAEKVYSGDATAIANLLKEMFTAFAVPSSNLKDMFEWFNGVLKHYDKELGSGVLNPPHRGLWAAFGGADALACVLHFFCGPEGSSRDRLPAVDLSRFFLNPVKVREVRENASELFELFDKCHVPIPWVVDDFVRAQDHEMLLVQLGSIYVRFKDQACALPLVVPGGVVPGGTSATKQFVQVSHDGDVAVTGVRFREPDEITPVATALVEEKQEQPALAESLAKPIKRTFTGYHSFSSQDDVNGHGADQMKAVAVVEHESELVSSEIFFLSAPSLSVPPPPVLSEVMARSSNVSLERALARTSLSNVAEMTPANTAVRGRRSSSAGDEGDLPPPMLMTLAKSTVEDPVSEIKSRLRERIHAAGAKVVLPSLAAEEENLRRSAEERRLFELEDRRRKAFLKQQQALAVTASSSSKDESAEQERVKAALSWMKTPRDVMFHNRNSVDQCRVFVSRISSPEQLRDYCVQWFDINDDSDAGNVLLSDVYDITTTTSEDGTIFVYIHLNRTNAVKTSKGRPSLKVQPVKHQEALRFFANLTVLLEDVRNVRIKATPIDDNESGGPEEF